MANPYSDIRSTPFELRLNLLHDRLLTRIKVVQHLLSVGNADVNDSARIAAGGLAGDHSHSQGGVIGCRSVVESQPMEACEPGKCPKCVTDPEHLERTQQRQWSDARRWGAVCRWAVLRERILRWVQPTQRLH